MRILSIDPGLDYVVGAVFDYDGTRKWAVANAEVKMRAFVRFMECKTSKGTTALPDRLAYISTNVKHWCTERELDHIVIEMPAIAGGAYRSKRGAGVAVNTAAMGHFHMALGTIIATCAQEINASVELYYASSRMKKTARIAYTKELFDKVWPTTVLKLNADRADALYIGLAVSWPTI